MAQFSPAYARHFKMNASNMYGVYEPTGPDPNAFIMPTRLPVLHIETRPRWGTIVRNRRPPDPAEAAYRKFQIDCYTSRPPPQEEVVLSTAMLWPTAQPIKWGFPPSSFAWLYRLILDGWWLLLAPMALVHQLVKRVCIFLHCIWEFRKQQLMRLPSWTVPCLLCFMFILTMIRYPVVKEETLEYVLQHNCEIRGGPFELGEGLRTR